ncbi:uncharacterized protein LOC100175780 [Ciona intestinalis]
MGLNKETFILDIMRMFEILECPFTINMELSYMEELLLHQSPQRMRVLAWVFSLIDEEITEKIENYESNRVNPSKLNIDGRVQLLTEISSDILGLCHEKDYDLIRGKASDETQLKFWKNLLGIALTVNEEKTDVNTTKFEQGNIILEELLMNCNLNEFECLTNLPLSVDCKDTKLNGKTTSTEEIEKTVVNLKTQLEEHKALLDKYIAENPNHLENNQCSSLMKKLMCSVQVLLGDLAQLQTTYQQTHDINYETYCRKSTLKFTRLGDTMHHLQRKVETFLKMMSEMKEMQRKHENVTTEISPATNVT